MFKLITRPAIALVAATVVANAAPAIQSGHVTFVDDASGQILIDNQLVAMNADLAGSGLRVGDEVVLTANVVTAMLMETDLADATAPVDTTSGTEIAMGVITYANAETGIVVLNNSIVLNAYDDSEVAALRLGQMAETRFSEIAGIKFAEAITALE